MTSPRFDPAQFPGTAPVFPLPGVVLFPRLALPLHIFEPRYRQMTQDALAGDRLIAMALLKPGWEPRYYERPEIHPTVCVGEIIEDRRRPDGTFDILLCGVSRARVIEEVPDPKLYRRARLELVADREEGLDPDTAAERREALSRLLRTISPGATIDPRLSFGALVDQIAAMALAAPEEQQRILNEARIGPRACVLLDLLSARAAGPRPSRPTLN